MILFQCDYNEGAHPRIMERMMETNLEQSPGYGEDAHCRRAAQLICKACGNDRLAVHFLVGGTQANMTVIDAALRSHQGVISAGSGHINVHETGAVESLGHKVLAVPHKDGKLTAAQVEELYQSHVHDSSFEHMVQPKMVYISNPTEYGTLYSRKELEELSRVCREHDLYLFMDGARLGYGLAAPDNELDLPFLAEHCDVFYIGGTKVGALFGEAVVIVNEELKKDFRYFTYILHSAFPDAICRRLPGQLFHGLAHCVGRKQEHTTAGVYLHMIAHITQLKILHGVSLLCFCFVPGLSR